MRTWVRSLASLSGLRIPCCLELQCRSEMQLGSQVAVAVVQASSYSSDQTPCLGTSIYHKCGPKSPKRQKKKKALKRHLKQYQVNQITRMNLTKIGNISILKIMQHFCDKLKTTQINEKIYHIHELGYSKLINCPFYVD